MPLINENEYAGRLAEPLDRPTLIGVTAEDWEAYSQARLEKLQLLYAHFGIDPNHLMADTQLAMALADRHVPGFRRPLKGQGRPLDIDLSTQLLLALELLRRRDGLTDRKAAERIAESGLLGNRTPNTIRNHIKRLRHVGADGSETAKAWVGLSEAITKMFDRIESEIGRERLIECISGVINIDPK